MLTVKSFCILNILNPFITEAVVIYSDVMDWFLYDNGLRHEKVMLKDTVNV